MTRRRPREGTLEVPQYLHDQCKIRLLGSIHKQAGLLDNIGQIRPRQSEVLEGTCKTLVLQGIGDEATDSGGQLCLDTSIAVGWDSDMPGRWRRSMVF